MVNKTLPMFVLGIAGDFNAGKSTVRRFLQRHGWVGIDCDAIVHDLYLPGKEGSRLIRSLCGDGVFFHNGKINRTALGHLLMAQNGLRIKVEHAVHPLVKEIVRNFIKQQAHKGIHKVCVEIPVYNPFTWRETLDALLWITAPATLVNQRLLQRKKHLTFFVQKKMPPKNSLTLSNAGNKIFLEKQIYTALAALKIPDRIANVSHR